MKLAVGVMGLCACLATVAPPVAARHASTVPLDVTLHATWNPAKECPPGVPLMVGGSLSPCYLIRAHGTFSGLGKVTVRESVGFLDALTSCMTVKSRIVLTVGTKGEVHADGKTRRCVDPNGDVTIVPFKITGGTGAFASATGNGTITVTDARETGRGNGDQKETWRGTLTFAG
jgi:hypothetical protein